MYLLGVDVGSSSVKASLVSAETGKSIASSFYPKSEAPISSPQAGWAEQDPAAWWEYLVHSVSDVMTASHVDAQDVKAIGISYQMHGLVCVDKNLKVLRPAIIWCDSRAVSCGNKAFEDLGADMCMGHLLNSPGNFTASKLKWVKDNEPEVFEKIYKVMLPGDYIALLLTGEAFTTMSGLSEGTLWDFSSNTCANFLLDYYGIPTSMLPDLCPTFGHQGSLTAHAASQLGLCQGIPVSYRAGDQPNNALSLNVFNPGEVASTAGTSGVVYGISDVVGHDAQSRVNTFAHVNHSQLQNRLGVLLCINGTGILNSWVRRNILPSGISYPDMNNMAAAIPVGAQGLSVLPFGNGAERVLGNANLGCSIEGLNFNLHTAGHIVRAAQEGIVFAFQYGMEIMKSMGMDISKIHAGNANMFLSPIFREALATVSGATIEIYDTDGSVGAALGAGYGAGIFSSLPEAFAALTLVDTVEPCIAKSQQYDEAYQRWRSCLNSQMSAAQ